MAELLQSKFKLNDLGPRLLSQRISHHIIKKDCFLKLFKYFQMCHLPHLIFIILLISRQIPALLLFPLIKSADTLFICTLLSCKRRARPGIFTKIVIIDEKLSVIFCSLRPSLLHKIKQNIISGAPLVLYLVQAVLPVELPKFLIHGKSRIIL